MGVTELGKLISESRQEIDLAKLNGRIVSIDAYNALYQFLASIRQPDGTPLMDLRGRVTSHLNGLLYRTINLLENGIKPVYVFDGKPPQLKQTEIERRRRRKEAEAYAAEAAAKVGNAEEARKHSQRAMFITDEMVNDSKELLTAMGLPWVQAPGEGEAEAAFMAESGTAWAAGSQDYDSLLFGAPRLVRNLTVTGKRKLPNKREYVDVKPELIELDRVLRELGLRDRVQLIDLAVLIGTDYNPDGVPGVGPQRALKLIKEYGSIDRVAKAVGLEKFPLDPVVIREYFMKPDVIEVGELRFNKPDEGKIMDLLVRRHDFSEDRVKGAIERLRKSMNRTGGSSTLDAFM